MLGKDYFQGNMIKHSISVHEVLQDDASLVYRTPTSWTYVIHDMLNSQRSRQNMVSWRRLLLIASTASVWTDHHRHLPSLPSSSKINSSSFSMPQIFPPIFPANRWIIPNLRHMTKHIHHESPTTWCFFSIYPCATKQWRDLRFRMPWWHSALCVVCENCFCGPGYQTLISLDGMQAGVLKREKERMDLYRGEIGQRWWKLNQIHSQMKFPQCLLKGSVLKQDPCALPTAALCIRIGCCVGWHDVTQNCLTGLILEASKTFENSDWKIDPWSIDLSYLWTSFESLGISLNLSESILFLRFLKHVWRSSWVSIESVHTKSYKILFSPKAVWIFIDHQPKPYMLHLLLHLHQHSSSKRPRASSSARTQNRGPRFYILRTEVKISHLQVIWIWKLWRFGWRSEDMWSSWCVLEAMNAKGFFQTAKDSWSILIYVEPSKSRSQKTCVFFLRLIHTRHVSDCKRDMERWSNNNIATSQRRAEAAALIAAFQSERWEVDVWNWR